MFPEVDEKTIGLNNRIGIAAWNASPISENSTVFRSIPARYTGIVRGREDSDGETVRRRDSRVSGFANRLRYVARTFLVNRTDVGRPVRCRVHRKSRCKRRRRTRVRIVVRFVADARSYGISGARARCVFDYFAGCQHGNWPVTAPRTSGSRVV